MVFTTVDRTTGSFARLTTRYKMVCGLRRISFIPLDYNEARTNLAILSFLNDKKKPIENYSLLELHDILCKYDHLTSLSGIITTNNSGVSYETPAQWINLSTLFFSILFSTTMTIKVVNIWI